MLFREGLCDELENRSEDFRAYLREKSSELTFYFDALSKLEQTPYQSIEQKFSQPEDCGAIPATELTSQGSFSFPFGISWQNHEQAREWAGEILQNRTTFAADGSQIYAGKETSVPVAAIQIGWFENPHDAVKPYEKNARFEILTPDDLFKDQDEPMNPDIRVEERRYLGEVAQIGEFLEKKRGWRERGERMPLAFFDNPLLVPFSQKGLQKSFLEATVDLVKLSRETDVPLVGYVDRSFSRDLLTFLDSITQRQKTGETTLYDASLMSGSIDGTSRVLEDWGDRSCFCYSKRRGLNAFIDEATGKSTVGFAYLQTTADSTPARLDLPCWVYEAGLLDEVLDVVRAECVIGLGYPYALETADQTAVISTRDREIFFRALQEFAVREKLEFSVSRKDASKNRRR
ncbi:MAG: DNA double-strand break repair nuclease NurA [Saprospiraceae bacterium]|nr:DNA double-strand break repair nuclease NurA [Pyrinomonadaceae bacterium]